MMKNLSAKVINFIKPLLLCPLYGGGGVTCNFSLERLKLLDQISYNPDLYDINQTELGQFSKLDM